MVAHKCQPSYEDRAHHTDTTIAQLFSWCDTTLESSAMWLWCGCSAIVVSIYVDRREELRTCRMRGKMEVRGEITEKEDRNGKWEKEEKEERKFSDLAVRLIGLMAC